MGNCISTKSRKPKPRAKRLNKERETKNKDVEAASTIEDKKEEIRFPIDKNNIFSPDRFHEHPRHKQHRIAKLKPKKSESHEEHKKHEESHNNQKDQKSENVKPKNKQKRAPIKNPKLYNEDIPIKPAKGANLNSWWDEEPKPTVIENKKTFNQEYEDDPFPTSGRSTINRFKPNVSSKRRNKNIIEDNPDSYEHLDSIQTHATNAVVQKSNFRNQFDDITIKGGSSNAPSIIASMHEFDYQPDLLESKIVARGRPMPKFNGDEEGNSRNFNGRPSGRNNKSQINNFDKSDQDFTENFNEREDFNENFTESKDFNEIEAFNEDFNEEDLSDNNIDNEFHSPQNYRPRPTPVRRENPQALTLATIQKELKKIPTINEASWKEIIKCQTEISKHAKKNTKIFLRCEAARSIILNSNSGRSNICKNSLLCIGDLFYLFPEHLSSIANDAISTIIRKTVQGTSAFIQEEANKALAKIVLKGPEVKLITHLTNLYKYQQASRVSILNCLTIIVDRLGEDVAHLKQLSSLAELTFQGLSDASQAIRKSANVLASLLQENCDMKQMLTKLHLKPEIKILVERSMAKYDVNKRDQFLQKITSIN